MCSRMTRWIRWRLERPKDVSSPYFKFRLALVAGEETRPVKIEVRNETSVFDTFRANRTRSLFNVEDDRGAKFELDVELPLDEIEGGWSVGLVVGASGTGKSSIGRGLEREGYKWWDPKWPKDRPIIEAITPKGNYDAVTGALAAVGLGDVPAWLRPHGVLSQGEQFRANLARLVAEGPPRVVVDEFTSVVDRQIARIGSMAFAKAWRRGGGQAVLLSCHHDITEWLEPDWIYDTDDGSFRVTKGCLQRPRFDLEVVEVKWSYWPYFHPHHYLDAGPMPFGTAYVGFVGDEPVVHLGMSGKVSGRRREARACRMVVMPEWQGAGVGMRFLNALCERELAGDGFIGKPTTTLFHTAHPGLVMALKRDRKWRQLSAHLGGGGGQPGTHGMKWGGHFRAVAGFRYYGEAGARAAGG